jgi:hypothetical protein
MYNIHSQLLTQVQILVNEKNALKELQLVISEHRFLFINFHLI